MIQRAVAARGNGHVNADGASLHEVRSTAVQRPDAAAHVESAACDAGLCPLGASRPGTIGTLRALVASHRHLSLETLETVALAPEEQARFAGRLTDAGLESFVLMTCNRAEVYWRSRSGRDLALVEAAWRDVAGAEDVPFERLAGRDAVRHILRVGSGLESMVLGEPEVLGQLRGTLDAPGTRARAGTLIEGLVQAAIRCGGRARAETAIGEGAISVASLAAQRLLEELGSPARSRLMVLGAGETGRAAARHLRAEGVERLVFVNRTPERAVEAARELDCDWAPLDRLHEQLERSDGVVVSVAAPRPLLGPADVRPALHGRTRPLAIADLSMPRAADPVLRALRGVRLWDLSDFERMAAENHARRAREVPHVEALIERELRAFTQWARQQSLRPLMNAMRERAERICRAELERALAEGPLDGGRLEVTTRRLVDLMVAAHADVLQRGADGNAA